MNNLKEFVREWLVPSGVWRFLVNIRHGKKVHSSWQTPEEIAILKKNEELKNRHSGYRCFILGSGSSVKAQNIGKLEGEFVISVNNTFVHPDYSRIKPRYHVLPPLLQYHGQLHSEENFVGWLRDMAAATDDAEMFMHIGDRGMVERNGLFRNRIIHWVEYQNSWDQNYDATIDLMFLPLIRSVSELALTVAVYLGFERVYLVGIDHDWFNGVLLYFYDHTKEHYLCPDQKDLSFMDSEHQMRRHAEIFRKYKYLYSIRKNIYNANADPKHYMDVFPKVEFDSLFDKGND